METGFCFLALNVLIYRFYHNRIAYCNIHSIIPNDDVLYLIFFHIYLLSFSGDVVLRNLVLKQSALSELDLPVQTSYGHLGSLVLKIPWKNLYSAPVEAYIDRLYLLAVPNNSVRYNAEREEKSVFEAKKAELERIQLVKKLENEKSKWAKILK